MHKVSLISLTIFGLLLLCPIQDMIHGPLTPAPCSIESLMIDGSLFSRGWTPTGKTPLSKAPIRWGVERVSGSFTNQEHHAFQQIYRGRNFEQANKGFFSLSESWFYLKEDEGDWFIPSEFNYESPVAENYRFGCSIHKPSGVQVCQMAAQYDVYVTRFYTLMSPTMNYGDLYRIFQAIDVKMARCLDK